METHAVVFATVLVCLLGSALCTPQNGMKPSRGPHHKNMSPEDIQRRDECLTELNIPEPKNGTLLNHAISADDPKTEVNKFRVIGCIMKKDGTITADGKFSKEMATANAKKHFAAAPEELEVALQAAEHCDKELDGVAKKPVEEMARAIAECLLTFHNEHRMGTTALSA